MLCADNILIRKKRILIFVAFTECFSIKNSYASNHFKRLCSISVITNLLYLNKNTYRKNFCIFFTIINDELSFFLLCNVSKTHNIYFYNIACMILVFENSDMLFLEINYINIFFNTML